MRRFLLAALALAPALPAPAGAQTPLERRIAAVMPKVVAWRRDLHQHPELSNRETRTAGVVAAHLRALGLEVRTGVAHTGVVGVLRGGRPGPVLALRADMDALPVTEESDLPFRSTARSTYNGMDVGVMHACGHDGHTAILMGVAEVLAGMRAELPGTVVFLFQPAEEGVPNGETGGAPQMIVEGALDQPKVEAIFGLHVWSSGPVGTVSVKPMGTMASSDTYEITVKGRQTHGAVPWAGVDPVLAASHVVTALQAIVARQVNLVAGPAIVTVGTIHGGVRFNIIPDSVNLTGTIRAFDPASRDTIHARVRRTATQVAAAFGATADVRIAPTGNPVTYNDPALTARMRPVLERALGAANVRDAEPVTVSEDFSHFQKKVPGVFFFVGNLPVGRDPATVAPNHSPRFFLDEGTLPVGVRALTAMAIDWLNVPASRAK